MRIASLLCCALAGCCVIVVENGGSDGGNPFGNNNFPGDSGVGAPVAICHASPTDDAGIGEIISFDGADSEPAPGDSSVDGWAWDFGDGTQGTGSIATHAYGDAGLFVATLTVTDGQGLTAQNSCPAVSVSP